MFTVQLSRARLKIETVRGVLRANDGLRSLVADLTFDPSSWDSQQARASGLKILSHKPRETPWRELDHSTALTSLYAAYESFVVDLLTEWSIKVLPIRHRKYTELPEYVRDSYLYGLSKILPKIGKPELDRY